MLEKVVPTDGAAILRFGGGDEARMRAFLRALYAFLADKGENTRRAYGTAIRQFFETYDWVCPADVDAAMVANYKARLLAAKRSDRTVYQRLSALSAFYEHLRRPQSATEGGLVAHNPVHAISRDDLTLETFPVAMRWETFEKILRAIPGDPQGLRDRAILLFFGLTGRRRAEVARLRVRDLDVTAEPYTYQTRVKGGRWMRWELPKTVWLAISEYWVASGRIKTLAKDHAVFAACEYAQVHGHRADMDPHEPLHPKELARILQRAAERAGVASDPSVHLHALRHMSAQALQQAGVDVRGIQEFLGHASLATTERYLERLGGVRRSFEDKLAQVRADITDALEPLEERLATRPDETTEHAGETP